MATNSNNDDEQVLAQIRKQLDEVDLRIVNALNERAALAKKVSEIKKAKGLKVYSPERELEILAKIETNLGDGPFPHEALRKIYANILSATRSIVGDLKIVCFGDLSIRSAERFFGGSAMFRTCSSASELAARIKGGEDDYGVLPVYSIDEPVWGFLEISKSGLKILAEVFEKGKRGERCLVVGEKELAPTGKDKTVVMCTIDDRVGALQELLSIFSKHHLSLLRIESIDADQKKYHFVIELEGHLDNSPIKMAIEELEASKYNIEVLGSYPVNPV